MSEAQTLENSRRRNVRLTIVAVLAFMLVVVAASFTG